MSTDRPAIISLEELRLSATVSRFQGHVDVEDARPDLSVFVVSTPPGDGSDLHTHPYAELFVLLKGTAEYTVGDTVARVSAGAVVTVPPSTPHRYRNAGTAPLVQVSIHDAGRVIQRSLPDGDESWQAARSYWIFTNHHMITNKDILMSTTLRIANVNLWVRDQDEALAFYTEKLGFEIGQDVDLGFMRWLTVHPAGQPTVQFILCEPSPIASPEGAAQIWALLERGLGGGPQLHTDDCAATHAELEAKGVPFTQPPTQMPYGTDCELIDPSGNRIRIVEIAPVTAHA